MDHAWFLGGDAAEPIFGLNKTSWARGASYMKTLGPPVAQTGSTRATRLRDSFGVRPQQPSQHPLAVIWLAVRTLTVWVSMLSIILSFKVLLLAGFQKSAYTTQPRCELPSILGVVGPY